MKVKLKLFFRLLASSILFWIGAMLLFVTTRYNGLEEQMRMFISESLDLPLETYYLSSLVIGAIFGTLYAFIELIFNSYLSKRLVPGLVIVLKSLIYFILIVVLMNLVMSYLETQFDLDFSNDIGWWQQNGLFWTTVIYFVIMSTIISILRIALDKFGRGMFFKILIGKYRNPQEEERILMFLDLKDSTKIAEQLGHKSYSNFIQDCFKDLNSVLDKHEAEVYQYVGDEAVLSWTPKNGFKKNNCVCLFYAFKKQLEKRNSHYHTIYGYLPIFKAGLHCGKLMIAEVGTIKKEIAYHGDVINTTARIQSLCNTYKASLLISEVLLNRSTIKLKFNAEFVDNVTLKGREQELKIFDIIPK